MPVRSSTGWSNLNTMGLVVFSDICNSTETWNTRSPEAAHQYVMKTLDVVRNELKNSGCKLLKEVGDEVIATYMFPKRSNRSTRETFLTQLLKCLFKAANILKKNRNIISQILLSEEDLEKGKLIEIFLKTSIFLLRSKREFVNNTDKIEGRIVGDILGPAMNNAARSVSYCMPSQILVDKKLIEVCGSLNQVRSNMEQRGVYISENPLRIKGARGVSYDINVLEASAKREMRGLDYKMSALVMIECDSDFTHRQHSGLKDTHQSTVDEIIKQDVIRQSQKDTLYIKDSNVRIEWINHVVGDRQIALRTSATSFDSHMEAMRALINVDQVGMTLSYIIHEIENDRDKVEKQLTHKPVRVENGVYTFNKLSKKNSSVAIVMLSFRVTREIQYHNLVAALVNSSEKYSDCFKLLEIGKVFGEWEMYLKIEMNNWNTFLADELVGWLGESTKNKRLEPLTYRVLAGRSCAVACPCMSVDV